MVFAEASSAKARYLRFEGEKQSSPYKLPTNAAKVAQTERKRYFWRCFGIGKPQRIQNTTTKAPNFGQICDLSHF